MPFSDLHEQRREAYEKAKAIGNYLQLYFSKGQGVRFGDCAVVSTFEHETAPIVKGHIKILTNRDAGQTYLEYIDVGRIVNVCVYHQKGTPDLSLIAQKILDAIDVYVRFEIPGLSAKDELRREHVEDLAAMLQITSATGQGLPSDLARSKVEPVEPSRASRNHIRILCKLSGEDLGLILPIVEAVEESLLEQDIEPGRVKKITHTEAKPKPAAKDPGGGVPIPVPLKLMKNMSFAAMKETRNQIILKLAQKFGSIDELGNFMGGLTSNPLKLKDKLGQKMKWADYEDKLEEMKELGLVKETIFGPALTSEGKNIKEYLINHKCELNGELRRNIRHRAPGGSERFRAIGDTNQKPYKVEYTNRNKVHPHAGHSWSGDLAVPETIIQAQKNSLRRQDDRLTIKKEDLMVYGKRVYVPMDICLLVDASGSMTGNKFQAACFLAEHLLLTSKDKVAVVAFQETRGSVVVPFTRKQPVLTRSLRSIKPGGMTPLADGIIKSIDLIKSRPTHNPTIVLITDGLPNYPLWTFDARKDALEAGQRIREKKIRLICIGVASNSEYLQSLCDVAEGKLFVVDKLDKQNLINIVRHEKRLANIMTKYS